MIYKNYLKRIIDIVLFFPSFLLLILPLIFISVVLLFSQGRPVIYKGIRAGKNNVPFDIYKFRTMNINQEKQGGDTTAYNDPRVTFTGKILRKYKLDELPQIFNILKGEMSFVGPRPELLHYTNQYTVNEMNILSVKPGMTDLSSILFNSLDKIAGENNADLNFETKILPVKNKLRMEYVENVSLKNDLKILFKTLIIILKKLLHVNK